MLQFMIQHHSRGRDTSPHIDKHIIHLSLENYISYPKLKQIVLTIQYHSNSYNIALKLLFYTK